MDASTLEMLQKRRHGSLRKLTHELGFPASFAGTLSDIFRARYDHVSRQTESRIRLALGLVPLPDLIEVPACATCGAVHVAGDCHGKPVARVVVLAPGEQVRRSRRPPEKWVDYATAALRAALINRQLMTGPRYYDRLGRVYTTREEFSRGKNH